MKNILNIVNVVCICSGVMIHHDNCTMEIPAVYLKMPQVVNVSSPVAFHKKRRSLMVNDSYNEINYPEPFSSLTTISYKIRAPGNVTITLYDLFGRGVSE